MENNFSNKFENLHNTLEEIITAFKWLEKNPTQTQYQFGRLCLLDGPALIKLQFDTEKQIKELEKQWPVETNEEDDDTE